MTVRPFMEREFFVTIVRALHDPEHPYFVVARGVAQNCELSYEALGLLMFLLSKPDDWKIVPDTLKRKGCGRDRVYKLLKELENAGHVVYQRMEAEHNVPPMWGGRVVHEQPFTEFQEAVTPYPEIPFTEPQYPAQPFPEIPTQQITDKTNNRQELNKGRNAPARVSTPAQVGFIQEHPVWLAFVKGWDGITPALEEKAVDATLTAIQVLHASISAGETSLEEIEAVTRWKIQQPRAHGYRLEYVKTDTPAFRAAQRAQANTKPRASPPPPTKPALTPTSAGVPLSLSRTKSPEGKETDRARTS